MGFQMAMMETNSSSAGPRTGRASSRRRAPRCIETMRRMLVRQVPLIFCQSNLYCCQRELETTNVQTALVHAEGKSYFGWHVAALHCYQRESETTNVQTAVAHTEGKSSFWC